MSVQKAEQATRKLASFDPERLARFGEQVRQLTAELTDLFPEREHLINQIIYALLTREHVLIHGVYGTGKTHLVNTLFGAFEGPTVFSIALTKFMSESHVIGIPDPKEMREDGVLRYQREGGILDAHFAELDEIFDANAPLLRVLLGILNERHFKRGRQFEKAELHTAIASTNGDPETVVKQAPELGAVIDRFIFLSKVTYVSEADNRRRMYQNYASGKGTTVRIPYADLAEISGLVVNSNQVTDPAFLAVYDEVVEAYKKAAAKWKQIVSDRRACKLIRLCEASAVLHGRPEVDVEDILAIRWGLCMGNDKQQHDAFLQAATPIIERAKAARQQNVDELCLRLIEQYKGEVPKVPKDATDEQLLALYRKVNAQRKLVAEVKPQLPSTEDKKRELLKALDTLAESLNARLAS